MVVEEGFLYSRKMMMSNAKKRNAMGCSFSGAVLKPQLPLARDVMRLKKRGPTSHTHASHSVRFQLQATAASSYETS